MKYGSVRSMTLGGSPAEIGASHGESFAEEIRHYTSDRIAIVAGGDWSGGALGRDQIIELAESTLPAHRQYSEELLDEMESMAGGAGITSAEAVIVGGFTDFVDTVRGALGQAPFEDTCTAIIVPAAAADGGHAMLGQTWDMHDSATQHVVLFDVRPDSGPAALVFTTVGCVGQMGMNEAGIAVGINNLTAAAGVAGVTWPFVVRRALQQSTLDAAVECVLAADVAGAHNFLLVDASGRGVNIEAMPQAHHVTKVDIEPFVHTNHTLFDDTSAFQAARPSVLMESSRSRLARAKSLIGSRRLSPNDLMDITRDPEAVCQVSASPYHIESCGGAVMRPATGEFWAVWGRPDLNEYEHFEMAAV